MNRAESEFNDLYRGVIMEHYRTPRTRGSLDGANVVAAGRNRLCGDDVKIALRVREGRVDEAAFDGEGCAISMAAASMVSELLVGKSVPEAGSLLDSFCRFVTGEREGVDEEALGDLVALEGVSQFPARVKCALLAAAALRDALPGESATTDQDRDRDRDQDPS